jgi:predicted ester cyclase
MSPEEIRARTRQFLDANNNPDWETQLRDFWPSSDAFDEEMSNARPFREAFADYHFAVEDEDTIVENNRICFWGTVSATHVKEFPYRGLAGIPATGKKLAWYEVHVLSFDEEGKVVEHLLMTDEVTRLQQLGAFPSD